MPPQTCLVLVAVHVFMCVVGAVVLRTFGSFVVVVRVQPEFL